MAKTKNWKKNWVVFSLRTEYGLAYRELKKLIRKRIKEEETVPLSIFAEKLAPLEALVKYFKENLNLKFNDIASLLSRDRRTVWTTYKKAVKKKRERISPVKTKIFIPLSIFSSELTVFEAVIVYLKDIISLPYCKIAEFLNRDQRNIWTVHSRAKIKLGKFKSKPEGSKK